MMTLLPGTGGSETHACRSELPARLGFALRARAAAGPYHSPGWGKDYPRIQLLTIADLLQGAELKMLPAATTFKQAAKVQAETDGYGPVPLPRMAPGRPPYSPHRSPRNAPLAPPVMSRDRFPATEPDSVPDDCTPT